MNGLLFKDILILRRVLKSYFLVLCFYLLLTAAGAFDSTMISGFIALFIMMLPISSFAYDELARWDRFAAALPAGRRGVVDAKYLLVLFLGGLSLALLALFSFILWMVRGGSLGDMLLTGLCCVAAGLLMSSLLLPFLFRFGAEKGRLMVMAIGALLFLLVFGAAKLLYKGGLARVPAWPAALLPPVLIAASALALFVSYRVSLHIFLNKEL